MQRKHIIPSWIPTLVVAVGVYVFVSYASATERITPYWYNVIQLAAVTAISALGLNLIYGFNGQFSLGHIGFYAIGAYGSALITKDFVSSWSGGQIGALSWMVAGQVGVLATLVMTQRIRLGAIRRRLETSLDAFLKAHERWMIVTLVSLVLVAFSLAVGVALTWLVQRGVSAGLGSVLGALPEAVAERVVFALGLLNGGTMAAIIAYLVGLPLLRLSSDYFGIATLGFAIMVYTALQNSDLVIATMKGARGMVGIPRWTTWTWVYLGLCAAVIVMRNLIWSSQGRAIMSVREDETAAKLMGIDVAQQKAIAFAIGALFAGVAGGLYAHLFGFLHPSSFSFVKGFDPLIIIVFGGLGSMTGTIVASALFALIIEGLRVVLPQGFEDWRFVIYPVLLLIIMLVRQQGLLGTTEWGWLRAPLPPERDVVGPVPAVSPAGVGGTEDA
ncbi:MAG TPA: branched-chain amino acid ABC transporter permease [Chloroflexi bacterium]|jgi:branched-chain amino acid transport system permease protein|nr:branched-chain amino acid ABC transporter permease [Chloroflexota bacterium]